ncbi:Histidine-containing phosphotransfer protein [Heracleum sosnowskyi]|uniref:Histidine-containing phosphotransfer protein n=1 Tax=Heracleum sosnowskyi TaxID=360622 RepID=A0AAD8I7N0_9APIA|nr:Histidine-containing phosphotransfer protein [Heracleum sosnowskyi]
MEVVQLQRRYIEYATSLFNEGYLDDLFVQLQRLQDASNPEFVAEVISTYFKDSEKTLNNLNEIMYQQRIDFKKVDACVQKLKGSSSSIGAQRIVNACIALCTSYEEQNIVAYRRCAAQVTQEYAAVKDKLQNLFWLEQQIVIAGGAVPVLYK